MPTEEYDGTELLLKNINEVVKIHEKEDALTARKFNVFSILDVAYDEVRLCRLLSELLSPQGKHSQGNRFLISFMKQVMKLENLGEEELESAEVFREVVISGQRRIDIVIKTRNHYYPVEVKIYATDQMDQCRDYINFSASQQRNKDENWNLYYLTRFGEDPSTESCQGIKEKIRNISWATDITGWLKICEEQAYVNKLLSVSVILKQYHDAIIQFTNQVEDEMMRDIQGIINKDKESIKAALALESSLIQLKTDWLMLLFRMIEERMLAKGYSCLRGVAGYDFDGKQGKNFYRIKNSTQLGISYLCKNPEHIDKKYKIYARIEIWDNTVGIGYLVFDEKHGGAARDIANTLPHPFDSEIRDTTWWSSCRHVTIQGNESPDFSKPGMSESYLKWVSDETYREEFVDQCVSDLIALLKIELA
jgi:hypothetical protein